MTDKSTKKKTPFVRDGELTRRIRGLREALGLSQQQFAEKVIANRTQISEWEKGTEKPSIERLIAMGNIAEQPGDRMWFWRRAGLNEKRLREAFSSESGSPAEVPDNALAFMAPVAKRIFLGGAGELQTESEESLFLPSSVFSASPSVVAMKVPPGEGISYFFGSDDFVLIDRSLTNVDKLFDSMVTIFFENEPPSRDPGYQYNKNLFEAFQSIPLLAQAQKEINEESDRRERAGHPESYAERQERAKAALKRVDDQMAIPVVKFGWLRLQPAGGNWEPNTPFSEQVSRVALETFPSVSGNTGPSIPLTGWLKGIKPAEPKLEVHIKRPVHVVGRLVGWFKNNIQGDTRGGRREI